MQPFSLGDGIQQVGKWDEIPKPPKWDSKTECLWNSEPIVDLPGKLYKQISAMKWNIKKSSSFQLSLKGWWEQIA